LSGCEEPAHARRRPVGLAAPVGRRAERAFAVFV
jgi:hypothetical protein